jgi:hypothetical protein
MDRRMFLGILAGSLLAAPLAAAETPGPPPGDRVLIVDTHVHPLRSLHRGGFAVSASDGAKHDTDGCKACSCGARCWENLVMPGADQEDEQALEAAVFPGGRDRPDVDILGRCRLQGRQYRVRRHDQARCGPQQGDRARSSLLTPAGTKGPLRGRVGPHVRPRDGGDLARGDRWLAGLDQQ